MLTDLMNKKTEIEFQLFFNILKFRHYETNKLPHSFDSKIWINGANDILIK